MDEKLRIRMIARKREFIFIVQIPLLTRSVSLHDICAGVVMLDDVVVFHAHFGHTEGSVLAHADAVAPAAAGEGVARDLVA